jgi:hypothetical protein
MPHPHPDMLSRRQRRLLPWLRATGTR